MGQEAFRTLFNKRGRLAFVRTGFTRSIAAVSRLLITCSVRYAMSVRLNTPFPHTLQAQLITFLLVVCKPCMIDKRFNLRSSHIQRRGGFSAASSQATTQRKRPNGLLTKRTKPMAGSRHYRRRSTLLRARDPTPRAPVLRSLEICVTVGSNSQLAGVKRSVKTVPQ